MILKLKKNKINIQDTISRYEYYCKLRNKLILKNKNKVKSKPYMIISNIFERNIFCSKLSEIETTFFLGKKKYELSQELIFILSKLQMVFYILGFCTKDISKIKLLDIKFITISILKFFFKFVTGLLDIFIITIYSLITLSLKFFSKRKYKAKELYTIFFWKDKKRKSIKYYYPDYDKRKSRSTYAIDFYKYRFIFFGLINAKEYEDIFTALDFIEIKHVFLSLLNLLEIYFVDFTYIVNNNLFTNLINYLSSLKRINRKFLSLLNYYAGKEIIKQTEIRHVYIWCENQSSINAFAVSVAKYKVENNLQSLYIYGFLGSPYSISSFEHMKPNELELELGIWGVDDILMQDLISKKEIKLQLVNTKEENKIKVIRKSLKRFKVFNNIENKNLDKRITYISDGNPEEIKSIFNIIYKNEKLKDIIIKDFKILYIRLHPGINIQKVKFLINKSLGKIIKCELIDNKIENIDESINKSNVNIFGSSSYVNLSLSKNIKTIVIRTSFIIQAPIQSKYHKNKNIIII